MPKKFKAFLQPTASGIPSNILIVRGDFVSKDNFDSGNKVLDLVETNNGKILRSLSSGSMTFAFENAVTAAEVRDIINSGDI